MLNGKFDADSSDLIGQREGLCKLDRELPRSSDSEQMYRRQLIRSCGPVADEFGSIVEIKRHGRKA